MGLPASLEDGVVRRRAGAATLGGAAWPFFVGWRLLIFIAMIVWRTPERVLPRLHQRREIGRCGREIDRAIAAARRHQLASAEPEGDAPFAGPPPQNQLGAIVLTFPRRLRNLDLPILVSAQKRNGHQSRK
jgi:hypothetical protein